MSERSERWYGAPQVLNRLDLGGHLDASGAKRRKKTLRSESPEERRYSPRIPVESSVKLTFDDRSETINASLVDLGYGGIGLTTSSDLLVGSDISVGIGWLGIHQLRAKVRWRSLIHRSKPRYGLEFTSLDSDTQKTISDLLRTHFWNLDHRLRGEVNGYARLGRLKCLEIVGSRLYFGDTQTYEHCRRTSDLSLMLGLAIGLNKSQLRELSDAANMHDLGKLKVDRSTLHGTRPLTKEEWEVMRKHPVTGASEVRHFPSLRSLSTIIRHHHEWYDGSGYPDGLSGDEIPLLSRVLTLADSVDAMAYPRPYRPTFMNKKDIVEELQSGAGSQFDPHLARIFGEILLSR